MESITVDVASILTDLGASMDVDRTWSLERFSVGDEAYTLRSPARLTATLTNTGSGIVAAGTVSADVQTTCARCLCEFTLPLNGGVEGFFVRAEQLDTVPDDEEAAPIRSDNTVDLSDAVLAALVVEAPFAPLHDSECAGICPECGVNLNEATCMCEHDAAETDHPFAELAQLLPELEGAAADDGDVAE